MSICTSSIYACEVCITAGACQVNVGPSSVLYIQNRKATAHASTRQQLQRQGLFGLKDVYITSYTNKASNIFYAEVIVMQEPATPL